MSWTDERVETLKRMWGEGQSASQIAKELGGVTRNAVIGKVHRLGLSNRVGDTSARDDATDKQAAASATTTPPRGDARIDARIEPRIEPRAETRTETRTEPKADLRPDSDVRNDAAATRTEAAPKPAPVRHIPAPIATSASGAPILPIVLPIPLRKAIIPAGQPLPPQPSANEISPEALASVREVEKRAKRLSLMELTERTCKWPIGDPATEDFWFCGLPSVPGKPYCEAHVGVAFQPMSARRDRRR
jgi:GcrA cell cycle regulator